MKDGKRCSGSIPYGYNRLPNDKQTLVVDPVASEVVKRIFLLANDGKSTRAIAEILTEEKSFNPCGIRKGIPPRTVQRQQVHKPLSLGNVNDKKYFRQAGISRTHRFA